MTVAMAAAEKPAWRSIRLPPPDPRARPRRARADTTERTSPVTDSVRLRHRQGPARIVGGVPYSDRSSTLSLLPGAAVGRWLARQAPLVHGRLLDLGCGNQPFLPWYEPMVKEIVPVDAAPLPGVLVVDLSAPLPFPDGSFDTILCTSVLEHVDNAEQAMTEIARLLRPGGHALITVPFLYPTHEAPYDFWRCTHLGLASLIRRHGLEVASLDAQGGPVLMITHYGVLALTAGIRAAANTLGPLGWLVDNRVVRGILAAPQEAIRSRVSTRLGLTAKLASLGYMAVARKPAGG
jgi:SAM-dependent methyltransferase